MQARGESWVRLMLKFTLPQNTPQGKALHVTFALYLKRATPTQVDNPLRQGHVK